MHIRMIADLMYGIDLSEKSFIILAQGFISKKSEMEVMLQGTF